MSTGRCPLAVIGWKSSDKFITKVIYEVSGTKAQTLDLVIWLREPTEEDRKCLIPVIGRGGKELSAVEIIRPKIDPAQETLWIHTRKKTLYSETIGKAIDYIEGRLEQVADNGTHEDKHGNQYLPLSNFEHILRILRYRRRSKADNIKTNI